MKFSSSKTNQFKRDAKRLSREHSISHSEALDCIARQHGFNNWSLLAKHSETTPARKPLSSTRRKFTLSNRQRYYLHGDQSEDNPVLYYCARCDVFIEAEHFDDPELHQGDTHGERYLSSLELWNRRPVAWKAKWYRSEDAINILAHTAILERSAREALRSPFHRWLLAQDERDDPIGDLAVDARRDRNFPTGVDNIRELELYLSRYGDHVTKALREAWSEFSRIRPA